MCQEEGKQGKREMTYSKASSNQPIAQGPTNTFKSHQFQFSSPFWYLGLRTVGLLNCLSMWHLHPQAIDKGYLFSVVFFSPLFSNLNLPVAMIFVFKLCGLVYSTNPYTDGENFFFFFLIDDSGNRTKCGWESIYPQADICEDGWAMKCILDSWPPI